MKCWEYKSVLWIHGMNKKETGDEIINDLGSEGWELVSVLASGIGNLHGLLFFKRERS